MYDLPLTMWMGCCGGCMLLQPVFQIPASVLPQLIPVLLELPSDKVAASLNAIVAEDSEDIAKLILFVNSVSTS
jgi:hypothetical protein